MQMDRGQAYQYVCELLKVMLSQKAAIYSSLPIIHQR